MKARLPRIVIPSIVMLSLAAAGAALAAATATSPDGPRCPSCTSVTLECPGSTCSCEFDSSTQGYKCEIVP